MPHRLRLRKHAMLWVGVALVLAGFGGLVAAKLILAPQPTHHVPPPPKTSHIKQVPLEMAVVQTPIYTPTEVPEISPSSALPQTEMSTSTPLPILPEPNNPLWQQHQQSSNQPLQTGGKIAIVLDDVGVAVEESARAIRTLPKEVTLSFLPYGAGTATQAPQSHAKGHEVMVHIPMEPLPHPDNNGMEPNMGPHGLTVGMEPEQIQTNILYNLQPLLHIAVGANNHMGSRFTGWEPGMRAVLTTLQQQGLFFLDSKTIAHTSTQKTAQGLTLPILSRDVFLDHNPTPNAIRAELAKAVKLAQKAGPNGKTIIVIGHPLPPTLDVLEAELPQLVSTGIVLVPITAALPH